MNRRILFLLVFIWVVPFVSGGIFDFGKGAWSFGRGNWNPSIMGVIGIAVFLVMVIFFIRHRAGSYAGGYGHERSRIRSELRARKRARKDEKLEANQLRIDRRIDDHITRLRKIEVELNREKINLNKQLYELEEYEKRLMYWEKKIGRYLLKLEGEIDRIVRFIQKGKLKNPVAARQNLEKLYQQFMKVAYRHQDILERFRSVNRKEAELIRTKIAEEDKEKALVERERIEERSEFRDIKDELREALDELGNLEKAGASEREKRFQRKKIKDITLRRKSARRELRGEHEEDVILKKAGGIEENLLKKLKEQEEAINKLERIEATFNHPNMNSGLIAAHTKRLKKLLKIVEKNLLKVQRGINKLRKMDLRNEKLEERAEKLETRKEKFTGKEVKITKLGSKSQRMAA